MPEPKRRNHRWVPGRAAPLRACLMCGMLRALVPAWNVQRFYLTPRWYRFGGGTVTAARRRVPPCERNSTAGASVPARG